VENAIRLISNTFSARSKPGSPKKSRGAKAAKPPRRIENNSKQVKYMNFPKNPQRETQLDIALRLAARGYFVFPVAAGTHHDPWGRLVEMKKPFPFFLWRERSSNDPEKIREMWREYPEGIVAIDCGKSGILVVDGDRHKAEIDGVANWRSLFDVFGGAEFQPPIVQTASKGEHWYFGQPADRAPLRNSVGENGIDTRGDRGYVVAVGAITEAGEYQMEAGELPHVSALPVVPDWLREWFKPHELKPAKPALGDDQKALELLRLDSALPFIPSENRDTWRNVGMAIKWSCGDDGFGLWDRWSRGTTAGNFAESRQEYQWNSFASYGDERRDGRGVVDLGTVFKLAREGGWKEHEDAALKEAKARNIMAGVRLLEVEPGRPFGDGSEAANRIERLTDLGNARRLVRLHGRDIRYVHQRGLWLLWDGLRWRFDADGGLVRRAKAAVEAMHAEAFAIKDDDERNAFRAYAFRCEASAKIAAMIELAKTEEEVSLSPDKLDANPWLLGVENGVLDLKTGAFTASERDHYITKCAGTAYDPGADCPQWLKFLDRITGGDAELLAYLARAVGYTLTGATGEEVLFILYGIGANGKSTFRETVFALLGDYAVAQDASLLITPKNAGGATPELVRLQGARLVTVNETQGGDRLNESRVKFITGTDKITARPLYCAPYDFTPSHKAWLTTNHIPIVTGTDEGIWRRLHLIPFSETIPPKERVPDFRQTRLTPELPGILNWALAGLADYRTRGLQPPQRVLMATSDYREDMDVIGQWEKECAVRHPHAFTPTSTLHLSYAAWARANAGFEMSVKSFGRDLARRPGLGSDTRNNVRCIKGIKLKSDAVLNVGLAKPLQ
jgi:P4 family phage/plasmid primase-like protien